MLSIHSETQKLIQAALEYLEETKHSPIFASNEDCDEFRTWASHLGKPKPQPPQETTEPFIYKSLENSKNLSNRDQTNPQIQEETPKPSPSLQMPTELKGETPLIPPPALSEIKLPAASKINIQTPPPKPQAAISREPLPILEDSFTDLRKIWAKINPSSPLLDILPDDEIAKKIASRWKTKNAAAEISILSYHEPPAQKALLEQIAKAINILLKPAQIVAAEPIEKEKQWEAFLAVPHLRLTIACDYTLWQLGGLMQHYRETPSQGTRHLGSIPVFLLPDLSLYLKDPLLKRSLWKALCQTLCS